ncbi:MAG: rRNA adenine N-6-methyltransferase family protein [Nanoarchaeota archaeon]|nr:rRNA adenine N-6-methyltransferase family protein [Nanoarchaeota archaeon]MEC8339718.1 rRNA adenine N-6-methyltransferase family protein [Nanoarchaeota archaeon]
MKVEFDQHYLEDNSVITKAIENSFISDKDIILEIGPGEGVLTKEILKKNPNKLIVIEIDEKHKSHLENLSQENLEIHFANALDILHSLHCDKIIANIPYGITEKLYSIILEKKISLVTLLHGIDFYKNIIQRDTRWKYFVSSLYSIELLEEVPGTSFNPPTKVTSALVTLTIKEEFSAFDIFIQNLFQKRARTLGNALLFSLVDTLKLSKKEAKAMIKDFDFSPLLLDQKVTQIKNQDIVSIIEQVRSIFN